MNPILIGVLQESQSVFDDGCTLGYNIVYSKYRKGFTIRMPREEHCGTPAIYYDGEQLSYRIENCYDYCDREDGSVTCNSIQDLYDTMRFIEED